MSKLAQNQVKLSHGVTNYAYHPPAANQPLYLFCGGFSSSITMLTKFAELLPNYLVYDRYGEGHSCSLPKITLELYMQQLNELLQKLNL
jgi:hypothetical protein